MRLRSQLLLSAVGTSLLCGVIGTLLLGRTVSQSAEPLLESALRIGEQSLIQSWSLRRSQRRVGNEAVAQQTYFRAYLAAGDRAQVDYFAHMVRGRGVDVVAVVDRAGNVLAREGAAADIVALRATQDALGPDGELLAVAGELLDVFRTPVGGDLPVGYLVTAHHVSETVLRSDAETLGVGLAVGAGGSWHSTLPKELALTPRLLEDPLGMEGQRLAETHRFRTRQLGQARLLVAVPLNHVRSFSTEFVRQLAGVLLVIMVATAVVALVVIERITGPIEKLKEAADLLGRGQLLRTRSLLQDFTTRDDEIGALARAFNIAAQRLNTFVAASQRLVRHLNVAVTAVERSSGAVASGAAQQEERLEEVSSTLGPLTTALEQTSLGLADARNATISLSLVTSAADQAHAMMTASVRRAEALLNSGENPEPRAFRTASLLQQIGLVSKLNGDQREAFQKVREQVSSLKRLLDDAVEAQIREQHQGQFVHRATSEIGRLAKQHNVEAVALRTSAEQLRRDMEHLHKLLSAIDAQGQIEFDETAAASSGYYRPIRNDSAQISSDRLPAVSRRKLRSPNEPPSVQVEPMPNTAPSSISGRTDPRAVVDSKPPAPPRSDPKAAGGERSGRIELKSVASPNKDNGKDKDKNKG